MNISEVLESIPCPICGTNKLLRVSNEGQFRLPCCVSVCPFDGLVFLSPRWSKERYIHFYQNEYDSYYRPSVLTTEIDIHKYKNIQTICSRLNALNLINGRKSVLDIGAGMGWALQWLERDYAHFERLAAIESSKQCIMNLQDVVGASVISQDFDDDWKSTGFDLIIMRHVLEHFMNPIEALNKVRENLSSNGIVYIAVPDMMNSKGSLSNYWFRAAHTFYFSYSTLYTIASLANLRLIEMKSEDSELWGVFTRSSFSSQPQSGCAVYRKQMRIIKEHNRKVFWGDTKHRINNILSSLLPTGIKSWLKILHNRAKQ